MTATGAGRPFSHALVTGGAGFIGARLTGALLDAGLEVTVLDDLSVGRKAAVDPRAGLTRVVAWSLPARAVYRETFANYHRDRLVALDEARAGPPAQRCWIQQEIVWVEQELARGAADARGASYNHPTLRSTAQGTAWACPELSLGSRAESRSAHMPGLFDIVSWFLGLSVLEMLYVASAVLGGLVFLVRIVLLFFVGDGDGALDDVGVDSDAGFQLLSIQGLSGFFVMFGLVGLGLIQAGVSELLTSVWALVAGGITILAVAQLSSLMLRLQSSGNIELASTLGSEGTVYLTIPADGVGRAHIRIHDRLRTYDARSKTKAELKTGTPIRVAEIKGNMLVVEEL